MKSSGNEGFSAISAMWLPIDQFTLRFELFLVSATFCFQFNILPRIRTIPGRGIKEIMKQSAQDRFTFLFQGKRAVLRPRLVRARSFPTKRNVGTHPESNSY